ECLAAVAALMDAGIAEALVFLDHLGGRCVVDAILGDTTKGFPVPPRDQATLGEDIRRKLAPLLRSAINHPDAFADLSARNILLEARTADRKVNRTGFRRGDRTNIDLLAALRSGAPAVVEVIRELDRLITALSGKSPLGDVRADRAVFHASFRRIYFTVQEDA